MPATQPDLLAKTPIEIVQALLQGSKNPAVVHALVAPDATYVSLNYENTELKKIICLGRAPPKGRMPF